MSQPNPAKRTLLTLPYELRLEIYRYFSAFSLLILNATSRQLRSEIRACPFILQQSFGYRATTNVGLTIMCIDQIAGRRITTCLYQNTDSFVDNSERLLLTRLLWCPGPGSRKSWAGYVRSPYIVCCEECFAVKYYTEIGAAWLQTRCGRERWLCNNCAHERSSVSSTGADVGSEFLCGC
ncbi:hypothetical protein BJ508DRAFT_416382 [Ascobolus immersus RN42]|uniref:F-box domain-containing protein n=1 Tax=Ascobolus immersus RN42 TaxID=1160509 RepID=A0A3N4HY64_ASCIM|nr:hypothetical protein BJ508DRAFT_416382 [Ascobolus immersus RN42]